MPRRGRGMAGLDFYSSPVVRDDQNLRRTTKSNRGGCPADDQFAWKKTLKVLGKWENYVLDN